MLKPVQLENARPKTASTGSTMKTAKNTAAGATKVAPARRLRLPREPCVPRRHGPTSRPWPAPDEVLPRSAASDDGCHLVDSAALTLGRNSERVAAVAWNGTMRL